MKVSSALAGQIMIMYHHCATTVQSQTHPEPPLGLPRLRNGINHDFRGIFGSRSVLELCEKS